MSYRVGDLIAPSSIEFAVQNPRWGGRPSRLNPLNIHPSWRRTEYSVRYYIQIFKRPAWVLNLREQT